MVSDPAVSDPRRVLWINGAFGAGKTTTARLIRTRVPGSVIVDPEEIGSMLRPVLQPVAPVRDFRAEFADQARLLRQLPQGRDRGLLARLALASGHIPLIAEIAAGGAAQHQQSVTAAHQDVADPAVRLRPGGQRGRALGLAAAGGRLVVVAVVDHGAILRWPRIRRAIHGRSPPPAPPLPRAAPGDPSRDGAVTGAFPGHGGRP